jgi:hypothetical protein
VTLPPNPTEWGLAAWDMLRERAAIHEAEGLSPHDARIRAEAEVRTWTACGGDAAIRALPPLTQGTGGGRSRAGHAQKHKRGPALTEPLSPKLPRHDSNMRPGD